MNIVEFPKQENKNFKFFSDGEKTTWENDGYTSMELVWEFEHLKQIFLNGEYN